MANLTGQPINTSYAGLIKTTDNAGIDGTFKQLTDGLGTNIPIEVSNADLRILSNQIQLTDVAQTNGFSITDLTMAFGGAVDFSAATVTGLPGGGGVTSIIAGTGISVDQATGDVTVTATGGGGAAGLVAGTGTDSMASAASLTTTAAIASGDQSIAIGNEAEAVGFGTTAIGEGATANGNFSAAYGRDAIAASGAVAIGNNSQASGSGNPISIGYSSQASSQASIGIGNSANAAGFEGIAIGNNSSSDGNWGIALGASSEAGTDTISIGRQAGNSLSGQPGNNSVNLGHFAHATGADAIAIGSEATALQTGAVAIGADVDANIAQTVSIKALEVQTDSTPTTGGIIMSDAGGTDRRINIDATGNLQVDSTPVGGAVFNLPAFTVPTGAPAADTVYAVTTIPANTFGIGDVLEFRSMEQRADLNNIVYESYIFSDTTQTAGQPVQAGVNFQQAGFQDSLNGKLYYQKTMYIGATGTAVWNYGQANDSFGSNVEGGDPIETQAIDWTVDQYFYFQAWNDNTTGTVQNYGTVLRKIN